MTKATTVSLWVPRVAGIGLAAFLSLFALDAFNGQPFPQALPDFLIHLGPAAVVLVAVAVAWRLPLAGAAAFGALAAGYVFMVPGRADWILAVAGPLAAVGALFLVSALRRAA